MLWACATLLYILEIISLMCMLVMPAVRNDFRMYGRGETISAVITVIIVFALIFGATESSVAPHRIIVGWVYVCIVGLSLIDALLAMERGYTRTSWWRSCLEMLGSIAGVGLITYLAFA